MGRILNRKPDTSIIPKAMQSSVGSICRYYVTSFAEVSHETLRVLMHKMKTDDSRLIVSWEKKKKLLKFPYMKASF